MSSNSSSHLDLHIVLESIYCLHRMGDHQAADLLFKESQSKLEISPIHQKLSHLIDQIADYEQNQFKGEDYLPLMTSIQSEISNSEIPLYQGWMHFLSGYHLKKSEDLKLAAKFFQNGSHLNELYEVFYWMDKFRLLPAEEKYITFLRTFPVKSVYSLIKGNKYYKDELSAVTQIQKIEAKQMLHNEDEDEDFDCWHITENSIAPALYASLKAGNTSCLDIYSGLINDRGEIIFFFLSEINCLSYLISSQLTGASLYNLADFLGKSEKDTEKLLWDLQGIGIKIKKNGEKYFLHWEAKPEIIIPRSLKVIGLQEYVKKISTAFTKPELIEMLQLTQFGAEALMKKWALAGFIRPVEKRDNEPIWKFV